MERPLCHYCQRPGHFIRDCRTRMRDSEQRPRQAGNNQASSSGSPSAQRALVPYQAPSNDVRNHHSFGGNGGGSNGGYGGGYGGSGDYENYQRPWSSDYNDRNGKVEKMWSWMAEEIEERQRLKREKEENKRKEEEERRRAEAEEKRLAEIKDKDEFKASIGKMVETQMHSVCEEVLGKKGSQGEQPVLPTTIEIRRRTASTEAEGKTISESDSLLAKDEEIARLKQAVADMQRLSRQPQVVQQEQELTALRLDNQHLIQDVICLKEQVGELVKLTKSGGSAVVVGMTSAKEKGKAIHTPTAGDYVKLSDAYRRLRDDRDMAEREVQDLKERINRISSSRGTPASAKRKRIMRKSISPPSNLRIRLSKAGSPVTAGGSGNGTHEGLKFVKLRNETRDDFNKRVCAELSKLKKKDIERLCAEEQLEYATIGSSAAVIADVYTNRAFGKVSDGTKQPEDSKHRMTWLAAAIGTRMRKLRLAIARVCHRELVNYAIWL
ncbi:hypothetical protein CBR_g46289 [Chara braunii]|uniref:CCHC-type domain-containing protein n=1 Tax=Chara braunii TaxID=69332 RepID=A0A388M066_CHABU|nr:hypothetical protein CBR_g46289 [Chara braunii]|eukprot:GBG87921.1 hypothetical protein CBR_g46289 [Chara braunii]